MNRNSSVEQVAQWWRQPFAVFQTNLREIDADLHVDETLDAVLAHGADVWMLNTGGIHSNFPTDLPFQTRNPHLSSRPSGDLVGDAVEAAHARGVRVIARFDLSKVSADIATEHPDWCFRTADGEPQVFNGLWSVCPSGGYYQQRSFDILDEVIDRYAIDGVFFNWFNYNIVDYNMKVYGVCHCTSCSEGFRKWSGGSELPTDTKSPQLRQWMGFTASVLGDLNTRITAHIRKRSESILVVQGKEADMRYSEAHKMTGKELWPHTTGENVSELQHHHPPVPALVNSVSFVEAPYRMGGEEPSQFAQYLAQGIARGGVPSTYIMGAPGRIPYPSLEVAGKITRFYRRHQNDIYGQLLPASRIALAKAPTGRPGTAPSEEYLGVYSMLQQTQQPFDIVPLNEITGLQKAGRLKRFELIIVPDAGPLGDQAPALDSYVRDGGHVLLTGSSGFTAQGGAELEASPARERNGDLRTGDALKSTYATPVPQRRAAAHFYEGPLVPVLGALAECTWTEDAVRCGALLLPAPFAPPEKAYGHLPSAQPAYGRSGEISGSGGVTVVPWTIGQSYREVETTPAQHLFLEVVGALSSPCVEVTAPEGVETVVSTAGDDLIVHLLNLTGAGRRGFRPPVPLSSVQVRLPGDAPDILVEALVAGVESDVGGFLDVTLNGDFEVVRFRGAAAHA